MNPKKYRLILTGTDPTSNSGGIGVALRAYISSLQSNNISFESIPTYSPSSSFGKYLLFLFTLPKIFRSIRASRRNSDICIIYSHAGANLSLFREGIVVLLSRLFGARTVMHIHAAQTISYLASPLKKYLFLTTLIGVQHVFVLTSWAKNKYLNAGVKKSITVIPNPIDLVWEHCTPKVHANPEASTRRNILVMTRLVDGKGVDLVIDAMPYLYSDFKLNIAGTGPQLDALKTQVKKLDQENSVNFFGWVTGDTKQRLIDDADIFCHPTSLDAMPMNILEAMANGLPVVALNWGPIRELVPDGVAGFLVASDNPKEIAAAILKMKDLRIRQKMGMEARQWVIENFSSQVIGLRLDSVFKDIAGV